MSKYQSSVAATTMASVLRDCLDSISGDKVPIVVFTPHEIYNGNIRDILGDVPKSRVVQFYMTVLTHGSIVTEGVHNHCPTSLTPAWRSRKSVFLKTTHKPFPPRAVCPHC